MFPKSRKFLFLVLISISVGYTTTEEVNNSTVSKEKSCGHQIVVSDNTIGKSAEPGEFPWLALLKYNDQDEKSAGFRCVGTLISSRDILTTAVCATPTEVVLSSVRLGEHNLTSNPDCVETDGQKKCTDPVQDYKVENITVHKEFNRENVENDIALIRLEKDIVFTDYIRPICLPFSETASAKPGDSVVASGWGRSITGELITIKKKVTSLIITKEECAQDYLKPNRTITENHLCTRSSRNNTAYTCSGDSGGPLMYFSENQWQLEGIVSFGIGCGYTLADGNTKVANYLDWIKENMLS